MKTADKQKTVDHSITVCSAMRSITPVEIPLNFSSFKDRL